MGLRPEEVLELVKRDETVTKKWLTAMEKIPAIIEKTQTVPARPVAGGGSSGSP
ncbi:hypothetical protein KEJ36_02815 [Candidatus Bathyarchaeota archaeon]|nr:hypothetical protein [Candidatus Bathyarchaeota archaeon]